MIESSKKIGQEDDSTQLTKEVLSSQVLLDLHKKANLIGNVSAAHTGIPCQNFFNSTIIPSWKKSWVSREEGKPQ